MAKCSLTILIMTAVSFSSMVIRGCGNHAQSSSVIDALMVAGIGQRERQERALGRGNTTS